MNHDDEIAFDDQGAIPSVDFVYPDEKLEDLLTDAAVELERRRLAALVRSLREKAEEVKRCETRRQSTPAPSMPLTERQVEACEAVCDGQTDREIAARYGISRRTVRKHIDDASAVLLAKNRAELAAKFTRLRQSTTLTA